MPLPLPPLRLDQLVLEMGIGKEGRQSVKSKDLPATGRSKVELQLAGWLIYHCGWLKNEKKAKLKHWGTVTTSWDDLCARFDARFEAGFPFF